VTRRFAADLGAAVEYALDHKDQAAESAAVYGGVPGGLTGQAEEFIQTVMTQLLDAQQAVPEAA
jgi:hypothetical protein